MPIPFVIRFHQQKEGTGMMDESEFILLYLQADDEVKNQIDLVLIDSQQLSESEE